MKLHFINLLAFEIYYTNGCDICMITKERQSFEIVELLR